MLSEVLSSPITPVTGSDLAEVSSSAWLTSANDWWSVKKFNETDCQTKKEDMDSRKILPGNITEIFTLGSKNFPTKHFDSRFPR